MKANLHKYPLIIAIIFSLALFIAGCGSSQPNVDMTAYSGVIDSIVNDSMGVVTKIDKAEDDWSVYDVTVNGQDWFNTTETNKKRLSATLARKIREAITSVGAINERNAIYITIYDDKHIKVAEVKSNGDVVIKM